MMIKNISVKSWINFTLLFIVAVILMYFAFRGVNLQALGKGLRKANYFWVILSLTVATLSHIVRALRWRLLMEPLGYKPSVTNTVGAIITGYFANLVFPRLGEVTRCGTLQKTDKIPFESLFGTVLVERIFDVIMMFVLLATIFFVKIDFFGKFLWENVFIPLGQKLVSIFQKPIPIIIAILVTTILLVLIRRNAFGSKFSQKVKKLFRGLVEGIKTVFTMKKRLEFIGYTLLLWIAYWLMTWFIVFATGPTNSLGLIDAFFLLVVGSFGMAAPVQGGFGAFHIMTASALGIYGISKEDGLVYAIISHESQTIFVILLGIAFMVYFYFLIRNQNRLIEKKS